MSRSETVLNTEIINPVIISFEGEQLEAEFRENLSIKVGEIIPLQIVGKQYECRLIRSAENRAYFFVPFNQYREQDPLRQCPRVAIPLHGIVIERDTEYRIQIVDLSSSGIGFISKENELELGCSYNIVLDLPSRPLFCKILIMNHHPGQNRYGAMIIYVEPKEQQRLTQFMFLSFLTP